MSGLPFFKESREQSKVKAKIVTDYFEVWAKVIIPTTKKNYDRIAYIDLFAGPGRYEDGTKSTPLKILERAISNPDMRDMLVTIFNDGEPAHTQSLSNAIDSLPNIGNLKHKPQVHTDIVDDKVTEIFDSTRMIPSLTFLDPWGYKGLSSRLIHSVIKDWGCDCIIFFNYNRINMGLGNKSVEEHMNTLFGKECADKLRIELESLNPSEREATILNALSSALKELGGDYVLPFRFRSEIGNRISHHLIFVTKHPKGYEVMKDIMAGASSSHYQGVASFEYSPVKAIQPYLLLPPYSTLDQLKHDLLDRFAGHSLVMSDIHEQHNVGTCYIKTNYKQALLQLEEQGEVSVNPPVDRRRKNTLANWVSITFPLKE